MSSHQSLKPEDKIFFSPSKTLDYPKDSIVVDYFYDRKVQTITIFTYDSIERSGCTNIAIGDLSTGFSALLLIKGTPRVRIWEFHESGLLEYYVECTDGTNSGVWYNYDESGNLIRMENYTVYPMICDPCSKSTSDRYEFSKCKNH